MEGPSPISPRSERPALTTRFTRVAQQPTGKIPRIASCVQLSGERLRHTLIEGLQALGLRGWKKTVKIDTGTPTAKASVSGAAAELVRSNHLILSLWRRRRAARQASHEFDSDCGTGQQRSGAERDWWRAGTPRANRHGIR